MFEGEPKAWHLIGVPVLKRLMCSHFQSSKSCFSKLLPSVVREEVQGLLEMQQRERFVSMFSIAPL